MTRFLQATRLGAAVIGLLAALWAANATGEWWAGAGISISVAGAVFQMVFHAYYYGRMIGSPSIVEPS